MVHLDPLDPLCNTPQSSDALGADRVESNLQASQGVVASQGLGQSHGAAGADLVEIQTELLQDVVGLQGRRQGRRATVADAVDLQLHLSERWVLHQGVRHGTGAGVAQAAVVQPQRAEPRCRGQDLHRVGAQLDRADPHLLQCRASRQGGRQGELLGLCDMGGIQREVLHHLQERHKLHQVVDFVEWKPVAIEILQSRHFLVEHRALQFEHRVDVTAVSEFQRAGGYTSLERLRRPGQGEPVKKGVIPSAATAQAHAPPRNVDGVGLGPFKFGPAPAAAEVNDVISVQIATVFVARGAAFATNAALQALEGDFDHLPFSQDVDRNGPPLADLPGESEG